MPETKIERNYPFHAAGHVWVVPEYHLTSMPDGTWAVSQAESERIFRLILRELNKLDDGRGPHPEEAEFREDVSHLEPAPPEECPDFCRQEALTQDEKEMLEVWRWYRDKLVAGEFPQRTHLEVRWGETGNIDGEWQHTYGRVCPVDGAVIATEILEHGVELEGKRAVKMRTYTISDGHGIIEEKPWYRDSIQRTGWVHPGLKRRQRADKADLPEDPG